VAHVHVQCTAPLATAAVLAIAPGGKQPIHLRGASTRKGKKCTTAQLAAKKRRAELTLKQKCDVIDQAQQKWIS
jgi:hypothetical protein